MRRALTLLLAMGLVGGCSRPGGPREAPPPSMRAIVARALPAVVLLVRTGEDGKTSYGAGFVVGEDGLVLTNLHVVGDAERLEAMLYRKGRTSYTPMDGGLARFLFENAGDLVPARLVRSDPAVDLAVVRVDADTRGLARLAFSTRTLEAGDRVLALGHPGETVWSFTEGVVSALHHGAIQHDAAVNAGSSGGPLLDDRGEVVGINTSKLLHGVEGVAFSRPIALAARLLEGARFEPLIDFSTPASGAVGCIRAQELADPAILECFDWARRWQAFQEALRAVEADLDLSPGDAARLAPLRGARFEAEWLEGLRERTLAWLQGRRRAGKAEVPEGRPRADVPLLRDVDPVRLEAFARTAEAAVKAEAARRAARIEARNGVEMRLDDAVAVQGLLKMGLRAAEVHALDARRAWVRLEGRNLDGSTYAFSELWVRASDHWRQAWPPPADASRTLPPGWPPPFDDHASFVHVHYAEVLHALREQCAASPECVARGRASGVRRADEG